ncbi:myosin-2 isoform X2 [Drosophila gunungcola]|uniref:myosin-2 isoform X2 n=1 Tax=Drosophila gunungcola TaxID=103775 RepID=UPI0022E94F73|nr:myosin-2 isoform X2 [Drosophila gunungcola]
MSAPVRGNKASKLRAEGKVEKLAPIGPSWALISTRGGAFPPAPTSRGTSPIHIPNRRRPSCIPTSRIPIRRLAGGTPIRDTPLEAETNASVCSLPLLPASENKVGEFEVDKDAAKRTKCTPRPRAKSTAESVFKPSLRTDKSHHRVIELNKVRALESQHKKLESLQSEFMHKLRTLAPKKLQGVYKFVAVVVNDECKVVVHADDLLRLPKNLPTESVHDLKERCRAVVDSGFMVFYDHLQLIQKSKDENEARNIREEIRNKLESLVNLKMSTIVEEIDQLCGPASKGETANKSLYREIAQLRVEKKHMESKFFNIKKEHCDQLNQLRSEYEANLADELAARDHIIGELKKSLRRSEAVVEEQSQRLAENSVTLANEDGTIGELRTELGKLKSVNLRMHQRLKDADVGLDKARHSTEKHLAQITYLEDELKEARELIVNLQQRPDVMDKGVMEKDLVIADLKLQMRNLEEHKNCLNMQVNNALKQHADFDEINGKYRNAMMQISELKEALKIKSNELETQSEVEDQLKKEMAKLREKIKLDQQMLTARSDLIKSLQKTEQESRAKLEKMYCQVGETNTLISQVNNELASKEEDSRNLIGTLTFKQMEVRRLEHVIQLLKEQNTRITMVRAEQEERNVTMQEEIKRLTQTLYSILLGRSVN